MATIGSAKATLVNKIDSLTSSATAKDTIFLAKALKENTTHHSFTFEGAWANSTAYGLDDVVTSGGNTYICILAYTSAAAGSFAVGSNWSIMAGKGTDGTTVGVGTAGQVLKTKSDLSGTEWGTITSRAPFAQLVFSGNTGTVFKSYGNFSSVVRTTTGRYNLNFSTPIANNRYIWQINTDAYPSRTGNHIMAASGFSGYYFVYGLSQFSFTLAEVYGSARSDADIVYVTIWEMP